LYNTLNEIGILVKLFRLITLRLNETYNNVRIVKKILPDELFIQNGLKKGDVL